MVNAHCVTSCMQRAKVEITGGIASSSFSSFKWTVFYCWQWTVRCTLHCIISNLKHTVTLSAHHTTPPITLHYLCHNWKVQEKWHPSAAYKYKNGLLPMQYVFLITRALDVRNSHEAEPSDAFLTASARACQKHVLHGQETVSIFISP